MAELKSERKDFGMRDSSSFIIEPYLKATTVRSPWGFMSQATYWAQLLFPGITVLKVLQTEARKIEPLDMRTEMLQRAWRPEVNGPSAGAAESASIRQH